MKKGNKNLEILKEVNPNLLKWIKESKQPEWFNLITSRNNKFNMLVKIGTTQQPAYDLDDPEKTVKLVVDQWEFFRDDITVIVGMGLGYLAHKILKKKEKGHHVVVVEPNGYLIKKSLELFDFSKWLKNNTLIFASPGKSEISFIVSIMETIKVVNNWNMMIEPYSLKCMEYSDLTLYTTDLINQIRCNTGTVCGAGAVIAENDIKNLPYVVRHRGVEELTNIYKDKPAVLVSTGPSLQKNIHLLKDIRDKVIIIAVAQALRILKGYGIDPDFITTVDYGDVNYGHFRGLFDSMVPLVCLNRSYFKIIKNWQGPKFIVGTPVPGHEDTISGIIEKKGYIEQGGSVSHMNLGLALKLGCNPIAIIGQDLSYVTEKSHINDVDEGGKIKVENGIIKWKVTDHRSNLHKHKEISMGVAHYVPGYFGGNVLTNLGLASFITSFENIIERYKGFDIFNCTQGGVKMKGMKQLVLAEFIKRYCKNIIKKKEIKKLYPLIDNVKEYTFNTIKVLESDLEVLKNVIYYCKEALETAKQMKECPKSELKGWIQKNKTLSNKAHEYAKKNSLVGVAIFQASREIHSRELKIKARPIDLINDKKLLLIRVKRNELILNAANKASEKLKKHYLEALRILKEYQTTQDESLLQGSDDEKIDMSDAEKFLSENNFARPLIIVEKILKSVNNGHDLDRAREIQKICLEKRADNIEKAKGVDSKYEQNLIDYNDLIDNAQTVGREKKDWKTSLGYLRKAIKIIPDKIEARWGCATTYNHIGDIDKAITEYKKLIKDFPDNLRFQFEYGQVLIRKDLKAGLKQIGEVMDKTKEFDSFLGIIGDMHKNAKMYNEAIDIYKEYLDLFPLDLKAMENLEWCYKEVGKKEEASLINKKLVEIKV